MVTRTAEPLSETQGRVDSSIIQEKVNKINDLGVEDRLAQLQAFHEEHGHIYISKKHHELSWANGWLRCAAKPRYSAKIRRRGSRHRNDYQNYKRLVLITTKAALLRSLMRRNPRDSQKGVEIGWSGFCA